MLLFCIAISVAVMQQGNGLKLCQGRFRLDIRNNFFSQRAVMQWHSCPRRWWSPPPLEVFQNCVDVALRDVVSGHGGGGGGLVLDLVILEIFSSLNNTMILFRDMASG